MTFLSAPISRPVSTVGSASRGAQEAEIVRIR